LLLFGEVAPKTVALIYSHRIADIVALPTLYLRKLLFPVIWLMNKGFAAILNLIGHQKPRALTSEEYSTYIEMSADAGAFSKAEKDLLGSVFELRQIIAEEVMTPRVNLAPIRANTHPEQIAARIKEKKMEFYPIISKDIDDSDIILAAKDFFLLPREKRKNWLKECTFQATLIPANVGLTQVLRTLQHEKVPAALVVDEYGRTVGMISMKDVYIQLVGEVETIYDKAEFNLKQLNENTWQITGMMPLFELEEAFGIEVTDIYESNSLNGLFGEVLGRLPANGDSIEIENIKLSVQKIFHKRVVEVQVTKLGNSSQGGIR
jgi:putative hemolysin